MSKVLVILETAGGKLRSFSLPGITCGQQIAAKTGGRRILTLVYDKSLGMMRAVERVVH